MGRAEEPPATAGAGSSQSQSRRGHGKHSHSTVPATLSRSPTPLSRPTSSQKKESSHVTNSRTSVTARGHAGPCDGQRTLEQAEQPRPVAPRVREHSSVPGAIRSSTGIDKIADGQRGKLDKSQLERRRPCDRERSVE